RTVTGVQTCALPISGQLFGVLRDRGGEAAHELCPVAGRDRPPGGEGRPRPGHRLVGLLQRGLRDLGQDLLGRRLDDLHAGNNRATRKLTPESKPVLRFGPDDAGMNKSRLVLFASVITGAMIFGAAMGATVFARGTLTP